MKPFASFFIVSVLNSALLAAIPVALWFGRQAWALSDWTMVAHQVLAGIAALSLFFMLRRYEEANWIRSAFLAMVGVYGLMVVQWIVTALAVSKPELFQAVTVLSRFVSFCSIVVGLAVLVGYFYVQAPEIRPWFRWLAWVQMLTAVLVVPWAIMRVMHYGAFGMRGMTYLMALPHSLLVVYLNYRFWNGSLGNNNVWEEEIDALGEETVEQ